MLRQQEQQVQQMLLAAAQEQQAQLQRLILAALDLSEDELRAALKSASVEKRFAAAYAVGERRLPWSQDLIPLLTDDVEPVRQASRRSLVILSFLARNPEEAALIAAPNPDRPPTPLNKLNPPADFGPLPGADAAQQKQAAHQWTHWWDDQKPRLAGKPLPPAARPAATAAQPEASQLAAALLGAEKREQQDLVARYRDARGGQHTAALASAIPRLAGDVRREARDALAERLARMTDRTLAGYLRDDDAEVRRAAALGVAMRESKAHVAALIDMLRDPEPTVARAAHAALHDLTEQDFGPDLTASEEDRDLAVARWRGWWDRNK